MGVFAKAVNIKESASFISQELYH